MSRERVDVLLVARGLAPSRTRARALIEAGKVSAAGAAIEKPSELVDSEVELVVSNLDHPYVSRGGLKLAGALADLSIDLAGSVIADVGASTGGFTDCALQHGASRVYAIDVGRGQLHESLRADPRVIVREAVNARHLTARDLPEAVDFVLVDASFISLTKLLPAVTTLLKPSAHLLALVKPQFEIGAERVGKRGVVKSDVDRGLALEGVVREAARLGLVCIGHVDARLHGPEGNREIFAFFRMTA